MKPYYKSLLTLVLLFCSITLFAQDKPAGTDALLKEGVALNDARKYTEAIAKYDEVLKTEPNNAVALYEKGFSLTTSGKNDDAIPCFEKVIELNKMPNAYAALANIYDIRGDFDKATSYYTKGIAAWPRNGNLWYNLALSYLRQKKYTQAEAAATESIKINPRHVASHQIYGYAVYFQGKTSMALLALANYLMFVPPAQQANVACVIIKKILHDSPDPKADALAKLQQETIAKTAAAATAGKTNLMPLDSLSLQLTAVFTAVKEQQGQYNSPFFSKYFGNFFGAIATTTYMDVFTHYIAVSLSPQENVAWLKARPDDVKAFNSWLGTTKRETE